MIDVSRGGAQTSTADKCQRTVPRRVGESDEDVERGGFQGLHAREWDQLLAYRAIQVTSTSSLFMLDTFFIALGVPLNSAVQFTTYEQLKKVCMDNA